MTQHSEHTLTLIPVRITHLDGPSEGQIDQFQIEASTANPIRLGRDPSCEISFPGSLKTVSRRHAEINWDGESFSFTNLGKNGSLVNDRDVDQVRLQPGDVISLSRQGPRLSFEPLTEEKSERTGSVHREILQQSISIADLNNSPSAKPNKFLIQFGLSIKHYYQEKLVIGSGDDCDFQIQNPLLGARHLELFSCGEFYFARPIDTTHNIYINNELLQDEQMLYANDLIQFRLLAPDWAEIDSKPDSPILRYAGDGRFLQWHGPKTTKKKEAEKEIEQETEFEKLLRQSADMIPSENDADDTNDEISHADTCTPRVYRRRWPIISALVDAIHTLVTRFRIFRS